MSAGKVGLNSYGNTCYQNIEACIVDAFWSVALFDFDRRVYMSMLIPPHSHKSYLSHPEDRNFLSGSMKGSKFRMYPEVFRAPDRLPNQTLRITEVGCTIHHDSEYPCETSICMMGTSHVSKSHQNILLPRARKPHVQALKRGELVSPL